MENTSDIVDHISDPVIEVIDTITKNVDEDKKIELIEEDINNKENIKINNNILSDIQSAQNSLSTNLKVEFDTSGIAKSFDSILSVIASQQNELNTLNSQVNKIILDKEIAEKEAKEAKELLNNTIEKQELANKNVEEMNENLKEIGNNIKELASTYKADKLTAALNIPEVKSDDPNEDSKPSAGIEMISNLIRGLDDQKTELETVRIYINIYIYIYIYIYIIIIFILYIYRLKRILKNWK
jgi:hypothetical protein